MTKKHFIALADMVKHYSQYTTGFTSFQKELLADFCLEQNPRFDRNRWLNYIAGTCGPNGGKVKVSK